LVPPGGTEAISTAPGAVLRSRYFWITSPPSEWPTSTGGDANPATARAASST
jgi:hypothetical protein